MNRRKCPEPDKDWQAATVAIVIIFLASFAGVVVGMLLSYPTLRVIFG